MAVVDPDYFVEAQPSKLALFGLLPTQTGVEKIYYKQVLPVKQITDSSPIQFSINAVNGLEYIDIRNSFMSIKARIIHNDGSYLENTEYVGPVNLLSHALFEQVDVTLQGKYITAVTGHYPYKAMIQTFLKYGTDAKTSQR